MSKEAPTEVFRRALRHFGTQLSLDDLAVVLGAIVERQQAADESIWKHFRALSLFVGIKEETYIGGQKYAKGTLIRQGDDLYIAKSATSAHLSNGAYWLRFAEMPGAPPPAVLERKRKKVQVVEHDDRGRIKTFIETWEASNE